MFSLIDTPIEPDPGAAVPAKVAGNLTLQNVQFRYNTEDPDAPVALNNISLDIAAGETVALVGGSGGGKTTLLGLLPRFYDVSGGQILLDGVDLRDYQLLALRRQFALVSQDVILFNDTVAANIAYGDPQPDQARIEAAAKAAYAHDFIMQMPQGYATQAGQNGSRFPAASASAWRLRVRCIKTHRSCCSMKPPAHSTPNPSARCRRHWKC